VFIRGLSLRVKGTLYPAVSNQVAREQSIPLPPLPEQKRIAARLNEQIAAAARLRVNLEAQLAEIEALPAALLRKAFSGGL
jgi:type I restriction enzyme S subunit